MKKKFLFSLITPLLFFINVASAAEVTTMTTAPAAASNPHFIIPSAPDVPAKAYILVDANSGTVLAEKNSTNRLAPASLTKLMSLYVIFGELSEGKIKLTDMVPISKTAWQTGGSRMFVQVDTKVKLEDLLQGIIVASGNDATVALAEYVAGTQDAFVQLMDQQALTLGMTGTHYTDPTGLPDPNHYSTAKDFSILSAAIIRDYPQYYHYFSEKWFTYNNIRQPNRNNLLWGNFGVDGLKTGHTEDAGYCLIGSAKQNDMRLIAIVMGTNSEKARATATQALLQYGFRFFKTQKFYDAHQTITTTRVYGGQNKQLQVGLAQNLAITIPSNNTKNITTDIQINKKLYAPILKGQTVGTINIKIDGNITNTVPLLALEDNPKGNLWRRFIDWFAALFHST